MPPKAGYKAFKPPRPKPSGSEAREPEQQKGKQPRKFVSSDSEDDVSDVATANKPADDDDDDVPMTEMTAKSKKQEQPLVIPPKLLTRLMHEHFKKDDTRITKEAMSLLVKYFETFAIEAIGRANDEREEAVRKNPSADKSFLEVEDLEKMVPQLLQDF